MQLEVDGVSSCQISAACSDRRQPYATPCYDKGDDEHVPHQHLKLKVSCGIAESAWEISTLFPGLTARMRFACTRW